MTAGVGNGGGGLAAADLIADLIAALIADGATVAAAESVTGGRLVAALTSVPGSSAVVRGSVVAYANDVKIALLGVDPDLLEAQGAVCAQVAEQMATGARERLRATYGLSTTGEAGPTSASGSPVGTIFLAVAGPRGIVSRRLDTTGSREVIQSAAIDGALLMLAQVRADGASGPSSGPGASSGFETGLGNIEA